MISTAPATSTSSVLMWISGFAGASYGAEIPVKSLISPALAFLYRPLGSLCSTTERGASMKTSMKGMAEECFSCNSRASCRSEMYGEMKAVTEMVEESAKRSETSPIRRMFSTREAWSKPRSLLRPNRMLSPSNLYAWSFLWSKCCSSAVAMVDLPEALKPVSQTVQPFWPRRVSRSSWVTAPGWKVMFVAIFFYLWVVVFGQEL